MHESRSIIHSAQNMFYLFQENQTGHEDIIVFSACHLLAQKRGKTHLLDVWSVLKIDKKSVFEMEQRIFEALLQRSFDRYPFETLVNKCKLNHFPRHAIDTVLSYFDDSLYGKTHTTFCPNLCLNVCSFFWSQNS